MKIVLIIETVHAANATEEYGPFDYTFIGDKRKVWDIIHSLLHFTYASPQVKSARNNSGGRKSMLVLYNKFFGANNVDHLQNQAVMKLQNLTYTGE